MKTVAGVVAGFLLVGYITTADYTPPPPDPVVYDPYQAIWTPQVTTDCDEWEIRQRDAGLEDLWPHVDHMTLDGVEYSSDEKVTLPRDGDRTFEFRFHSDGQQIYKVSLAVETRC